MKSKLFKSISTIVLILVFIFLSFPYVFEKLNYGLDLQGGFEILYEVEGLNGEEVSSDMVTNTYKTILKRIDSLGVNEPIIIVEGNNRIRVQLAGVTNEDEARQLLGKTAVLSFRDIYNELLMTSDVLQSNGASYTVDEKGKPAVSLKVKDVDTFYDVTSKISNYESNTNYIVIWLDFNEEKDSYMIKNEDDTYSTISCDSLTLNEDSGTCISAATVSQGFASDVIISGNFSEKQATNLVDLINSGNLSTKLVEISSKTVPSSFGEETLNKTFIAAIIGLAAIVLVITAIFKVSGFIASVGILIYTFLTIVTFVLLGGVLTLPGIAALVIGIGMAIDAPVISLSRIKDNLKQGKNLQTATIDGNKESFMSIFDANITTLIIAIILFIFGESSVKGFATMLIISILVTMLVMVWITRKLINLFVKTKVFNKKLYLFIGYKDKKKKEHKLDFIKKRIYVYIVILVVFIIGIVSITNKGINLGIDFKGGTSITFNSEEKLNYEEVSTTIEELGYEIYDQEKINENNFYFKLSDSLDETEINEINTTMEEKYQTKPDIGVVSNIVSKELVKNAIISIIIAIVAIIIYLSIRFTFNYAVGGIISLVHDVLIIVIFFSLFGLEINSIFIAALLSIIGYSINDTIVTFDRMREITKNKYKNNLKTKEECKTVVNDSLKSVLGRSIITTLTTLCPVVSLMLFGSREIFNFNLALLIGMIAGVLSSIYLACQIWYELTKRQIGKGPKKHWLDDDDEKEELKIKGINS